MHEVGIIAQALDIAVQRAHECGARKILAMRLQVGAQSGVVPEALRFGWDVVTADTCAQGAALIIDELAAKCRCAECGEVFEPDGPIYACPRCGHFSTDLVQGRELQVLDIEVELQAEEP